MSMVLFVLLAGAEILWTVWSRRTGKEKKEIKRAGLLVRAGQLLAVGIAMGLPQGQKWRFVPALGLFLLLLAAAALAMRPGKPEKAGRRKAGPSVPGCILRIVLTAAALVPAFVFTGYAGLPVTGDHKIGEAAVILTDPSRTEEFEQDGSCREVPVHFYYPADAKEGDRFPLVIFSHGAFGYYQSNTSTYMELASNGYVVAALDHPYHAFFTKDTEGRLIIVDRDFLNTALNLDSLSEDPEDLLKLYRAWMDLRTGDMAFALDTLEEAAEGGGPGSAWTLPEADRDAVLRILDMTDLSSIGLMGHSMGGATSVALGRDREDIDAVIDIDGTMLSEYIGVLDGSFVIRDEAYRVPLLEFNNWDSYNELKEYLAEGYSYPNDMVMKNAETGYSVTIQGTKHMDFTDLPLLSPMLGNMLGSGERDTGEAMTIVNTLVLRFFNCYLKGEGAFTAEEIY